MLISLDCKFLQCAVEKSSFILNTPKNIHIKNSQPEQFLPGECSLPHNRFSVTSLVLIKAFTYLVQTVFFTFALGCVNLDNDSSQ